MWNTRIESLGDRSGQRTEIYRGAHGLTFSEVAALWRDDARFREFYISLLAQAPWPACLWETPPVTTDSIDRGFEFVLLQSRGLATMQTDGTAFGEHFGWEQDDEGIMVFPNLGGDAVLVVPGPRAPLSAYPHLVAFSRRAPIVQQHVLWRRVAETLLARLGDEPVWLSTSGLGVPWVHVRLDDRPKYYQFGPYRSDTEEA
ncbi:MAG: hypothetical protein U9R74_05965 [Pseudomonadota bacterium]|nr:hypothetical protein [Pseudomonadota bacterium]